ncbi:helix-turn-helix domain-containing protein [Sedimenticola selenatireducens]|jgi:transcriptional regulator with XRE-family HTH domain|uniref:Helix-turn-helix transcriptional regulator n=1 Tax=Sedimenticola selenatireducens TaxID=191960 RepID=A0A558DQA0_9GAMM|nr:helix-turn-helix transcriptional regulator [Sedimenticola selenatireducens]TVO73029.1 helix-turn-helix transcriptional regulator [Sedimenticola selenatireducens]TVT63211.1 MAG: helix-turn-helix transcriptional regulator [Sedimenticola selenatireducens]
MRKSITSPEYKVLLAWLRKSREAHGLSMRDLALRIDEPHSFIGKIETGERRLDVAEYVEYCRALQVDPFEGIDLLRKGIL